MIVTSIEDLEAAIFTLNIAAQWYSQQEPNPPESEELHKAAGHLETLITTIREEKAR